MWHLSLGIGTWPRFDNVVFPHVLQVLCWTHFDKTKHDLCKYVWRSYVGELHVCIIPYW